MTELEKLQRRLESWRICKGPHWLMGQRARIMGELKAQIEQLKQEQGR